MATSASLEILIGTPSDNHQQYLVNNTFSFQIPLSCPYCIGQNTRVGTWGTYPANLDERTRFRCYECEDTFNTAKLPFWINNLHEMVWKLAQLTIKSNLSVHSLANQWNIPETTLRVLVTEIKEVLSTSFERAKQLDQKLKENSSSDKEQLRIIAYDEGFLKLLGVQAYLIFTLDKDGRPLTLCIENNRDSETIYNHFLSAMSQLGGIDIIISDGAPAILTAARALRQDLTLIMQIHQGDAKRCRIIKLKTIPDRKLMEQTTIEMHTGSLLRNSESELRVSKSFIYPKKLAGSNETSQTTKREKKDIEKQMQFSRVLQPEKKISSPKSSKKRKSNPIKGQRVILTTGPELGVFELSYLDPLSVIVDESVPNLQEIQGMISLVQKALPNQWITSNRAEVFNALHDRVLTYEGRKTFSHANRDLSSWGVMKFYPETAKKFIRNHDWHVPYSLLVGLWPLLISKVKMS